MSLLSFQGLSWNVALDEDAVNTAYKLKKWYGLLFKSTDVVHLKKDVKDMVWNEIEHTFQVH